MPDVAVRLVSGDLTGMKEAPFAPSSLNEQARTVEAVLSTGAPVLRSAPSPEGYLEEWWEELAVAGADLARMVGGPVLVDHRNTTDSLVGTVEACAIRAGQIVAKIRLGSAARSEQILGQVRDGILRGLSVGYRVRAWQATGPGQDGRPVYRATDWQPLEVSFVPIPADPGATVRSAPATSSITSDREVSMQPDTTETVRQAREGELARIRSINTAARSLGLEDQAEALIAQGVDLPTAQQRLIEVAAARNGDRPNQTPIQIVRDAGETARAGIIEAVAARLLRREPEGPGQHYRGHSIPEMARDFLEQHGVNTRGWSPSRLVEVAMKRDGAILTTSDFTGLLVSSTNKAMAAMFMAAQSPLRQALTRVREVNDFRPIYSVSVDSFTPLKEVVEAGPVPIGSVGDVAETYQAKSYAAQMPLSIQAIVNDDLGAFEAVTRSAAQAAAAKEASELVALLTSNSGAGPTLADGTALFATARGNLAGAGTTLDTTNVAAARLAMRGFKSIATNELVPATPRFLLVGPARELLAEQLIAALYPATTTNVNPFAGTLTPLVEPRVSGNAWWLFSDPAEAQVLEIAYLSGRTVPLTERFEGPDHLGPTFRVQHHFGVGVVGWRGAYRNPGN